LANAVVEHLPAHILCSVPLIRELAVGRSLQWWRCPSDDGCSQVVA